MPNALREEEVVRCEEDEEEGKGKKGRRGVESGDGGGGGKRYDREQKDKKINRSSSDTLCMKILFNGLASMLANCYYSIL